MSYRTTFGILVGVALATPVLARPEAGDVDRTTLSEAEIQKYFAPYIPKVKDCYVATTTPGVSGDLRLDLVIHRDGSIARFGFTAPGVIGPRLAKLGACLRPLSDTWYFPVRSGATTAVIPLRFQRFYPPDQPK